MRRMNSADCHPLQRFYGISGVVRVFRVVSQGVSGVVAANGGVFFGRIEEAEAVLGGGGNSGGEGVERYSVT